MIKNEKKDTLDKSNSTDLTIEFNETFFASIGSDLTTDSLFFLLIPICILGLALNLLSLLVFWKINLPATRLYTYLRGYALNSCVLCALGILVFVSYTPSYFPSLSLSYFARVYRCVILNYVATSLYFFGNILDIVINVDRLSIFVKRLKRFQNVSPYIVFAATLLFCFVVNLPVYFWYYAQSDQQFIESAQNFATFSYCGRTTFLVTRLGLVLSLIDIFIRDVLTLILEISTNILLMVCIDLKFLNPVFPNSPKRAH